MRTVLDWAASAILNRSKRGESMGFQYSLNPYRGCSHACRYCYARESHRFLNLNVAEDFEQQLFVKHNLGARLAVELRRVPSTAVIAVGTVTDPYQPLEGRHHLTRTAATLLAQSGHPFTITTKSPLIERDIDILAPLGHRRQLGVHVSLMSLDRTLLQHLEPGTSPPRRRLELVRRLKQAGIPVGVFAAPIIPALSDQPAALDELFAAIRDAGADWVMTSTTRLSPAIREYFIDEVSKFNADAAIRIRSLYGPQQYVDASYRQNLNRELNLLFRRYHLSRTGPVLVPFSARPQIAFAFD